jgi:hypothetical protein
MLLLLKQYPLWGKMKLAARYKDEYGESVSSWQFQRLIGTSCSNGGRKMAGARMGGRRRG